MRIRLNIQTKRYLKTLGKTLNQTQQVAAQTLNESAEEVREDYNKRLKNKTNVRTKFTTNASKVFKSRPIASSGVPRKLSNINSKIVVRNMKGGKDHYLKKLEEGTTQKGSRLTMGKVPVPLNAGRVGGKYGRAIAGANRLSKGKTQTLSVRGRKIGVRGDGYSSTRKRWGTVYSAARNNTLGGDTKKPFYMIDNKNQLGIFKMKGKKIRKIRKLEKTTVKHKAEPHFKSSVKQMSPKRIQQRFVKNAKMKLRGK